MEKEVARENRIGSQGYLDERENTLQRSGLEASVLVAFVVLVMMLAGVVVQHF